MIQYILECIAFQLAFLIIYDFFLKRETFFQWNRVYLIGTYVLSLVLPWIKIEALKTSVPENYYVYPEFLLETNIAVVATGTENTPIINLTWQEGILYSGMLLAAFYFGYKLYQLYRLSRLGSVERFPNFTRIVIKNSELAFSFFRSIFLGDKILDREHGSIIKHELVHIEQRHSLDLLFFELMRIVGWFNPLVYVYQNRIAELHEFIADAQVPKTERQAHYNLLLSQVFQTQNISFVNHFFKSSLIKKRIVMLQKSKSKNIFQLKYLLLLPLVFGMLAYSSTSLVINPETSNEFNRSEPDDILIAQLKGKIDKNIQEQGSISNVFLSSELPAQYKASGKLTKEEFFEYKLLHKEYVIELLTVTYPLLGEKVSEEMVSEYQDLPLPTSKAYAQYLESLDAESTTKSKSNLLGVISFAEVENVPVFPGCENDDDKRGCFYEAMRQHIRKNFKYPKEAQEKGIQGRVNTMFIINEQGKIIDVKYRGPDTLLTNEAERIISRLPQMQPGEHKGKKVKVTFSIPITFKLNSKGPTQTINYDNASDVPFAVIDEIPVFPGCEGVEDKRACFNEMMQKHISKNFNYPQEAQEKGIQGRVNLMFVIGKDGVVKNLRMRGPDKLLEGEAKRIIDLLPNMKPGKQKGKEVNVPFSIPISFKLESSDAMANLGSKVPENGFNLSAPENAKAIYIIDGLETPIANVRKISPDILESITVLKGKVAKDKYGEKGKNGIIEITLKKKD